MNNIPQKPYKPLTPFGIFVKHNFPFVEGTYEARDNYNLLCKVYQQLKTVEYNQGIAQENIEALYEFLNTLELQDEVNNKLDEMAESGELQEIMASYLNSKAVFGFDNVNSMKNATNLIEGSYAKTLGYYEKNDGGEGTYKIRNILTSDIVDNGSIIAINENLVAELIDNEINVKQFGAKGDNLTDDSTPFNNAIKYCINNNKNLLIPEGEYLINTPNAQGTDAGLYIDGNIEIIGNSENSIIKLSGENAGKLHLIYIKNAENVKLENLTIDGGIDEIDPTYPSDIYCHGIRVANSKNITFDGLFIKNVSGYGIGLQEGSSQDVYFKNLYVKNTGRDGIDTKNFNDTNENFNFNNITFENIGLNESAQSEGLTALDIRCKSANVSNIYIKNLTANNSGLRFHNTNATQGTGGRYGNASNIQVYGNNSTGEGITINETGVNVSNAYIYGMGIGVRITTEKNELVNVTTDTCSLSGFRIDHGENMLTNCTSQNMTGNTNGAYDLREGNIQLLANKIINASVGLTIYSSAHCKAIGCSFIGTINTPINRLANCEIIGCYGITDYTNQLQVLNGLTGTGIDLPTTDSFNTFYSNQVNSTIALAKGSSSSVADAPNQNTVWNILSIKNSTNYGSQFAFSNSGLFFRGIAGGTWDSWARIS